ncbi:MAG: DNA-processing protein DprA [bacterium]
MRIINFEDFPKLLKEINDPPQRLYIEGLMPDDDLKWLCVVGSRKSSHYGREICEKLIAGLVGLPIVIVSGLALGTDGIAHEAALAAGLKTVAVPGSGLDEEVLYPRSHFQLARKILESEGALISEFEPNTIATPYTFPKRNRIMAGLCHATLIVEAVDRSGTLITARLASDYNRDILAVPGSVFSESSYGPHMLIKKGATPITCPADIIEALGLKTEEKQTDKNSKEKYMDCGEDELQIIKMLYSPMPKEELIENLSHVFSISQINITLSILEIKGLIKETLGEIHLT